MTRTIEEKRRDFRALHAEGCFLLPNPWDIGSARMMQHLGFKAVASTSSGFAWSMGRPDYGVGRDEVLHHLSALAAATDLPVNADFESGFAHDLEDLAGNIGRVVETGIAGFSIEDTRADGKPGRYDTATAVARVRRARAALDALDRDVLLVARTEILFDEPAGITKAIDKLAAFAEAGADCLYAPGVTEAADIAAMVRAVAPKPLNVLVLRPDMTLAQLADLGVRRLSVGGGLARAAWGATLAAAEQLAAGSFAGMTGIGGKRLNEIFGRFG